jgi:hypothetical protein
MKPFLTQMSPAYRLIDAGIQMVQVSFANAALLAYFVATIGIYWYSHLPFFSVVRY